MRPTKPLPSVLIVIPCLNEAAHIGGLLDQLCRDTAGLDARIVVSDGGSADMTVAIARQSAANDPRIVVMDNPGRLQSCAVNGAVRAFGDACEFVLRIDVHGRYPADYCIRLLQEAVETGADSVVVPMLTEGRDLISEAAAAAQNSRLGTGGSKHRHASEGHWVDHGHHALMRRSAFVAVGGYDESFSHNEDAELDFRLRAAGFRIWLSGTTHMTYYPRNSFSGLFKQYLSYGRGRARNLMKHRRLPKVRQALPVFIMPVAAMGSLWFLHWLAALPLLLWLGACFLYASALAQRRRNPRLVLAGVSAAIMHLAWSAGFWLEFANHRYRAETA
ncbi:MAG: glycosyltransferase family 2 protein [Rhizobiaceae bacterium]|nr:glycosyltransferase family 2 protein [Rhizobiaceae bacterium]